MTQGTTGEPGEDRRWFARFPGFQLVFLTLVLVPFAAFSALGALLGSFVWLLLFMVLGALLGMGAGFAWDTFGPRRRRSSRR